MNQPISARRSRSSLTSLLLVGTLVTSCATARMYEGEGRSDDEVAIVEGIWGLDPLNPRTVDIESVDGTPVDGFFTRDVELLPGNHDLHVKASFKAGYVSTRDEGIVSLDARAGGRYAVLANPDLTGLDIFVMDLQARKIVGWRKPDLNEKDVPAVVPLVEGAWQLVLGKRKDNPRIDWFGWHPAGEPMDAFSAMVELVVRSTDEPFATMPGLGESIRENVKDAIILEDQPELFAYAAQWKNGWQVSITRPADGRLYLFSYQERVGEFSEATARTWVDRFRRDTLREWAPIDD